LLNAFLLSFLFGESFLFLLDGYTVHGCDECDSLVFLLKFLRFFVGFEFLLFGVGLFSGDSCIFRFFLREAFSFGFGGLRISLFFRDSEAIFFFLRETSLLLSSLPFSLEFRLFFFGLLALSLDFLLPLEFVLLRLLLLLFDFSQAILVFVL